MRPWTARALLLIVIVSVVIVLSSMEGVDAARPAPADCAGAAKMSTEEEGGSTIATWLGRLSHGPSPKGPGN
ncbi:hypothetical protein BHM03_00029362 [Ensete ventricosum]|nr:hypothetical protein BHM03_00029362 [Ensete ventricosum]